MNRYPLLFGYSDLVAGNGFLAAVSTAGRCLLIEDDDGWWIEGVTPGGVAAGGRSQAEATAAFRHHYRAVLHDIAGDTPDYESFEREVRTLLLQTNEPAAEEWAEAVQAVSGA